MEFKDCVRGRRSVRKFQDRVVGDDVLGRIVTVSSWSPSWKNSQTARFIAVSNPGLRRELAEKCVMDFEYNRKTILGAPLLVLLTTVSPRSGFERDGSASTSKGTHWESFDAGIVAQTFCLAAYEEGLATVILGVYDEAEVIRAARVPEGQKVSAMIAVGYADEEPTMPKRKEVGELLSFVR